MRENLTWKIVLILVLTAVAAAVVALDFKDIKLGFDLKGGVELRYKLEGALSKEDMKLPEKEQQARKESLAKNVTQTVDVIRKRLDPDGKLQPDIRPESGGELVIRLQGLTEDRVAQIKRLVETMGVLEFRQIINDIDYNRLPPESRKIVKRMKLEEPDGHGGTHTEDLWVRTQDEFNITGEDVLSVHPTQDKMGQAAVAFNLNPKGAKNFGDLTKRLIAKGNDQRLAIILNGRLQTAPFVRDEIRGGGVIIENIPVSVIPDTIAILQAGSLPTRLIYESEMFIGPELGTDSLAHGKNAIIWSVILVLAFMCVYYAVSGLIADFAVVLNLLFLFAVMLVSDSVLTLPGIAGMALTVGMLVDANILIHERIREELASGKALRFAIKTGYERAFQVIIDTHLTTIITGVVLWIFLTGPVRWFAVTLVIGLVASLFTSLFVTRVIFDLLIDYGWMTKVHMIKLLTKPKIRFIRWAPMWMSISVVAIVVGMGAFIYRGRANLGIDFTPGSAAQLQLEKPMDVETARKMVTKDYPDAQVVTAYVGAGEVVKTESNQFIIRVPQKAVGETQADREAVLQTIQNTFLPYIPKSGILIHVDKVEAVNDDKDPFKGGSQVSISFYSAVNVAPSPSLTNTPEAPGAEAKPEGTAKAEGTVKPEGTNAAEAPSLTEAPKPVELDTTKLQEMGLNIDDIKTALKKAGLGDVELVLSAGQKDMKEFTAIDFKTHEGSEDKIKSALATKDLLVVPHAFVYKQFVGPAQAEKMIWAAIWAICVSMFFIVVYVGVRFGNVRYGVAAIIALVHDVLITLGAIAGATYLANTFLGRVLQLSQVDLDLNVVAAVLTVVGYSINDTIVVFDRIRENLGRRREVTAEVIDRSVNQTLSRTILTSFTVLLVCVTLYVAGGRQLHALAFALTIGIITGTYSSIFIANPLLIMTTRGLPVAPATAPSGSTKEV